MTASANLTETPISGKYGRVLLSNDGNLYSGNFASWKIEPATEDLDTRGFEDAGWNNGLTGFVGAKLSLAGPHQVGRGTGLMAPVLQLLTPGRRLYYEFWTIHPDWSSVYGVLHRYCGVAQCLGGPTDNEAVKHVTTGVELVSRGPIYFPGQSAPAAATQLAAFLNVSGGGNPPS